MMPSFSHFDHVLANTTCAQHQARFGEPCFQIRSLSNEPDMLGALCNRRLRRAGYVGRISPASIRSKFKSRSDKRSPTR